MSVFSPRFTGVFSTRLSRINLATFAIVSTKMLWGFFWFLTAFVKALLVSWNSAVTQDVRSDNILQMRIYGSVCRANNFPSNRSGFEFCVWTRILELSVWITFGRMLSIQTHRNIHVWWYISWLEFYPLKKIFMKKKPRIKYWTYIIDLMHYLPTWMI